VDVDRMVALYTDGRMTLRQVAKEVGVSHVTVARRITEKTGQLRSWRLPGEY
jgi:DNA-binding Lrp family transcriptional regulator